MRTRTLLLLLAVALIMAFVFANWSAINTPTALSLGVTKFEAPLGLLLLGLTAGLAAVFAIYLAAWQGSVLLETRRHIKELQAQRALADQAEASRFTELRGVVQDELEKLAKHIAQTQDALRIEIHDNANSLAAMLAEIDHRLKPNGGDNLSR